MKPSPYSQKKHISKRKHITGPYFMTLYKFGCGKIKLGHVTLGDTRFKLSSLIHKVEIIIVKNMRGYK